MKNKKILMTLSALSVPIVISLSSGENQVKANSTYILNNNVKTYNSAQSAAKKTSAKSTYTKGNYYIYKNYAGMLNISKTKGKAGAWINPSDNKALKPNTQTKNKPVTSASTLVNNNNTTTTYKLNNSVKTYPSATNAINKIGARTTYQPGTYHIFKEYKGMLNISKTKGKAGAWINPVDNKLINKSVSRPITKVENNNSQANTITTQPPQVEVKNGTYVLNSKIKTYTNAADAQTKKNSKVEYSSGNYYIYKEYKGMLNISKTKGKAGAWINPSENPKKNVPAPQLEQTNTENNDDKKFVVGTAYSLNNQVNTYLTAADALHGKNAKSIKDVGYYTIYKEFNGMINITNIPGKVGVWINPADNTEKDPNKNKFTGYKEEKFYILDKVANGWYDDGTGRFFFNDGLKYTGYANDASGRKYFSNGVYSKNVTVKTDITKNSSGAPSINNFQYKNLLSKSNYTAEELNQVIEKFGGTTSKLYNQGEAFKEAEEKYGVNALYLLSHAALESAWGKTKIAQDKNNFFGIGAVDNSPYKSAKEFANEKEGVLGGAEWITNRYLKSTSFPASGAYLGNKTEGMNKNYSTDSAWGYKISEIMVRSNQLLGNKDK
ncbi:MAG: glucosaminidase domain-containing protein [Gemella sp.]|nr:glucosaminidase domain-containing protein [Gemella sp.]